MIARLTPPATVLPRSEAECLLDRALEILRDVYVDVDHPHATPGPGDDVLRQRIAALFAMVDAKRGGAVEARQGGVS